MKKLALVLSMLLTTSSFAISIGKVDVQKVLVSIKESEKVRKTLKKEFDKKQAEIKKEEDAIRKAQKDFEKQAAVLNAKTKAKKQAELQQKFMGLQQKIQAYQREIQKKEADFKAPILKKIRTIVESISKKKGLDFTYEAGTTPLLYVKKVTDLTGDVIKAYDKKHK